MMGLARWIAGTLLLTCCFWVAGLACLLVIANIVHSDIPAQLAERLPLLKTGPKLIFAGDSRAAFQLDPTVAATMLHQPPGFAVNIGYIAGEPLAVLAAVDEFPDRFRNAHLVVSVSAITTNDGIPTAAVAPPDVIARLSVSGQMTRYLPMRLGTLIQYIRDSFSSRVAADSDVAENGPMPDVFGLRLIPRLPNYRWPAKISDHLHYRDWSVHGAKSRFELPALCDLAKKTARLTVIMGPWSPRYDRNQDLPWKEKDEENAALFGETAKRCDFDFLHVMSVPGLEEKHFAEELHINDTGVSMYTRHVVGLLRQPAGGF
jgi:hypothetical protein